MPKTDVAARAIQVVVEKLGLENAKHARVTDDFALGQGWVYRVEYEASDGSALANYAHYDNGEFRVFPASRDLVQYIARTFQPRNVAIHILQVAGIPGVIALIITLTICYLAVSNQGQIPEILGHALTAILGFYFASSVYESTKDRKA